MPNAHSFRFGVIAENVLDRGSLIALARRAELLGYSTLLIRDHLAPDFFGPQLAPMIALMAAADATSTLRLGTLVLDNDFRHPAILAKETATLDLLSGGRFELGLGAGWLATEYAQSGIPYDPPGTRIGRLIESVEIIRGLLAGEALNFAGVHYRIDGLVNQPRPAQRPAPPILIGGGSKRILTFAGQHADIVGVLTTSVGSGVVVDDPLARTSAKVADKIEWIRAGAGDRFDRIELSFVPSITITDDRRAAAERLIATRNWLGVTVDDVWDMPSTLIGSPGEIVDQLTHWRDRLGFSYIVVDSDTMDAMAPVVATLSGR